MPTFFELDQSVLRGLDQRYAVRVFARLLRADARRMKIPLGKVHISEDIDTADGGIDARVDAPDSEREEGAILKGQTRYQIKTGEAFKPWQQAAIRKELFDKAKHYTKEYLAPGVRACMEEGGTYVLVCFGHD